MQPQANQQRIIIRSSLSPTLPPVVADARSVRQIVLNLLSNSIKFTGAGGQVIVSTALTDRGEAVLRVRDTGIGMTDKEIETAMEPFRQLATSTRWGSGGTGLGLPLTKALAEANRASFSIKSATQCRARWWRSRSRGRGCWRSSGLARDAGVVTFLLTTRLWAVPLANGASEGYRNSCPRRRQRRWLSGRHTCSQNCYCVLSRSSLPQLEIGRNRTKFRASRACCRPLGGATARSPGGIYMTTVVLNRRNLLAAGGSVLAAGVSGLLLPARAQGLAPTQTMSGGANNYRKGAAIVERIGKGGFWMSGTVRRAGDGAPLAGQRIQIWAHTTEGQEHEPQSHGATLTDKNGVFRLEMPQIVPVFGQPHGHLAYDSGEFKTVFLRPVMRSAKDTSLEAHFVLQAV